MSRVHTHALVPIGLLVGASLLAAGCRGPESRPREIPLRIDEARLAVELADGPRRDAAEAEMRREAKRVVRALFRGEPMPTMAPPSAAPTPLAHGDIPSELPDPERPSWADGVPKPPTVLEHDLPRAWPVEVRRGETPALLAKWAGTDARTLLTDNVENLKKRRWLRTGDRLMVTMSANQKVAFDKARDAFQVERLDAYFAKRYFEKVVVYRVKRGEYLSTAAKRYGDVPMWLLEDFNQRDFRSLHAGDEVLIPVVATFQPGQKVPPAMRVVDEEGRPLADERRGELAQRLENDLLGRARMALDDSNVFERGSDSAFANGRPELLPDYLEVRTAPAPTPVGGGDPAAAALGATPVRGQAVVARDIIVKPGETLMRYIQWSGVSLDAIKAANPNLDPDRILVGSRLALPLTDLQYVDFIKAREAWVKASKDGGDAPATAGKPGKPGKKGRLYVVAAGDTVHGIAKRYKTSLRAIRNANPGVDLDRIRIGQKLTLP
ncbi:MAG: LysM peptidoglycan-binding domain-containing protein [Deltaproteobacteria bacterium]|nr:MAG: LysM peptidoglycan-binding domain-containing protein [Deltaproteobacteria bacterium]